MWNNLGFSQRERERSQSGRKRADWKGEVERKGEEKVEIHEATGTCSEQINSLLVKISVKTRPKREISLHGDAIT